MYVRRVPGLDVRKELAKLLDCKRIKVDSDTLLRMIAADFLLVPRPPVRKCGRTKIFVFQNAPQSRSSDL